MSSENLSSDGDEIITLGKLSGVYGVKGWLKIYSHTEPAKNILNYNPWLVQTRQGWKSVDVREGRPHGKSILVKFDEVDDRDEAQIWVGREVAIYKSQLPNLDDGYYWHQLIGLTVINNDGETLGKVTEMFATGANDVVVVGDNEHLIPFVEGPVITDIDLDGGVMRVVWGLDWSKA